MQKNAYFKGLTIPFLLLLPQLAITIVLAILATMFMLGNINILSGGPGRLAA